MSTSSSSDEEECYIVFNYEDYSNARAVVVNTAREMLFAPDVSVLIVGEGNYTFSTALAAHRKGWKNIYVSQYPNEELPNFTDTVELTASHAAENLSWMYGVASMNIEMEDDMLSPFQREFKNLFTTLSSDKIKNLMTVLQNTLNCMDFVEYERLNQWKERFRLHFNKKVEELEAKIKETLPDIHKNQAMEHVLMRLAPKLECLECLKAPTLIESNTMDQFELGNHEEGWLMQKIDAKCLPMFRLNENDFFPRAVIFQCPYDENSQHSGELIKGLFDSANSLQLSPDFIFIGIANKFPYTKYYNLRWLLGIYPWDYNLRSNPVIKSTEDSYCDEVGYEFLGADADFPLDILAYGYKHQTNWGDSWRDIHNEIYFNHVMLCFKRKGIREVNNS